MSRYGATARTRAALKQLLSAVGARLAADGFVSVPDVPGVGRWWRTVDGLPQVRLTVFVAAEATDGALEASFHAGLELSPAMTDRVPSAVRPWWIVSGPLTAPAGLLYLSHEDLPSDRIWRPMAVVDLDNPLKTVDELMFATLDGVVLPRVAELSSAEALAAWASTPQVYGRFHGGIVRSCIVELCLLGRENLVPGVMAAFERGPLSRKDADHPESWAAFKAWIASVPPEQWAEWAQLPA